ncbi:MAG: glycerol-3-phosphate dehydrogenase [Hyphomonas sp.]|uniref:NAD(P)H-dependent glycerol-3-phosphate dehydrogenase n=1 Tax=Hyphomonas TaxID=85 RepID=UPI000B650859|nr:NAD(P)H-dependent glycerol-3-phosphate dehydrogenase [Hyphomonas sp.]MAH94430.1 glycerol-3-phosphate dehydrogenase [Hyphomonas sp.]OUX82673.1 MAG: glycerol-3-phosphate dehydrogenase [Hyphomonas sp. TMED31]
MTKHFKTFGVIGGGAWGTAIAQMLTRADQDVLIWCREPDISDAINTRHENTGFLPGVALNPALKATSDLADLHLMDALFAVAPAQHTRATLMALKGHIRPGTPVVLCSKGIELKTGEFMTQVLKDELPEAVPAVMSGPSFAIDVAKGLPTAVTFAIEDEALGTELIAAVATPNFRPYLAHDLLGAEIGGAVKNVLAIACGIALGKGLGRSAHAALIARGSAEMTRLALALGAERETLSGLSGLGDLVLTCSSETSRNMSCGMALGKGERLEDILGARNAVTEGVATAPVLKRLAAERGVDMPICDAVADVIEGAISVDEAIQQLLMRPNKAETV